MNSGGRWETGATGMAVYKVRRNLREKKEEEEEKRLFRLY